jgi:hypothetical protein
MIEMCFSFNATICAISSCDVIPFICCSGCHKTLCFSHFFPGYHFHWFSLVRFLWFKMISEVKWRILSALLTDEQDVKMLLIRFNLILKPKTGRTSSIRNWEIFHHLIHFCSLRNNHLSFHSLSFHTYLDNLT